MSNHKKRKSKLYLIPLLAVIFLGIVLVLVLIQNNQTQTTKSNAQTETGSVTPTEIVPTKEPGQLLSLDFIIPGIGTESANFTPLRPKRDVIIYFYKVDVNSTDPSIKPLGTVKSKVELDADPQSKTYGRFVNKNIDLGDGVPDGKYQIVFKTYQALAKVVKENEKNVGGKIFEVNKAFKQRIDISDQRVIIGDISPTPNGDNAISIDDYKAVVNCFGTNADSPGCKDKNIADLDDNGLIDASDLNIMLRSIKILMAMGIPPPVLTGPAPTNDPKLSPKLVAKPTPVAIVQDSKQSNGNTGAILFLLFLILLNGGLFVLYKKNKKFKEFITPFLQKIPFFPLKPPEKPVESSPLTIDNQDQVIEKDYFVKIQTFDDATKRTVLTLTDDTGPILGYFSGPYVNEGFAKVKGILKKEGSKEYIEVSEIIPAS